MRTTAPALALAACLAVLAVLAARPAHAMSTAQRAQRAEPKESQCVCVDDTPANQLIRRQDEENLCNNGYYCECASGQEKQCGKSWFWQQKYDQDTQKCDTSFNCKNYFDAHPLPTPTPTSTTTTTTAEPTTTGGTTPSSPSTPTLAPTPTSSTPTSSTPTSSTPQPESSTAARPTPTPSTGSAPGSAATLTAVGLCLAALAL